jgi:hypothetical protein
LFVLGFTHRGLISRVLIVDDRVGGDVAAAGEHPSGGAFPWWSFSVDQRAGTDVFGIVATRVVVVQ